MPLAEVERVAADLDQVTTLQSAAPHRLSGNIDLCLGMKKRLSSAQLDARMLLLDRRIFKQIDIALLAAADGSDRLVQNELLAGQRAGSDVQPAVLESALDDPHRHAGGHSHPTARLGAPECVAMAMGSKTMPPSPDPMIPPNIP